MRRREFLAASAAAGLAAAPLHGAAAEEGGERELIELRLYTFKSEEKLKAFDEFLAQAMVPALNRAGVRPVGAFRLLKEDNPDAKVDWNVPMLYLLLPHKTPQSLLGLEAKLAADAAYQAAGKAVLAVPRNDAAYLRCESSAFLGFSHAPRVETPAKSATRLMQLRIYESHTEERGRMKVRMFNEGGEIRIFQACGMTHVFFGQALFGSKLPNLTYMLGFESPEAMRQAWDTFRKHPDWQKLSKDPTYADTVSNITNLILKPAASSQI